MKKERYENVEKKQVIITTDNYGEIHRYKGEIMDERIEENSIPSGKYMYQCRHSDYGDWCIPATIEPRVVVNFCCTFISDEEIIWPYEEDKYINVISIEILDSNGENNKLTIDYSELKEGKEITLGRGEYKVPKIEDVMIDIKSSIERFDSFKNQVIALCNKEIEDEEIIINGYQSLYNFASSNPHASEIEQRIEYIKLIKGLREKLI